MIWILQNNLYQRIYGKSATLDLSDSHTGKEMIIEYPDLLDVSDKSQSKTENNNSHNHLNNDVDMISSSASEASKPSIPSHSQSATPTKAINKQIETRRADGRRRITPMFIPRDQDEMYVC